MLRDISNCEICALLGWSALWKCRCGNASVEAKITISTPAPSAWLILPAGWWKGKMTFKSFFQLHFERFLLLTQKVTKLILNTVGGVLWPVHYLVLQTIVQGEKEFRGVVHPEIIQKKIPKTPQGLPFKWVTNNKGANKQALKAGLFTGVTNRAPYWTSCPWKHPSSGGQHSGCCTEVPLDVPADRIRQTPKHLGAARSCRVSLCNSMKERVAKQKQNLMHKKNLSFSDFTGKQVPTLWSQRLNKKPRAHCPCIY